MDDYESLSDAICKSEEERRTWHQERLFIEATERICQLMNQRGMTQADLARKIGHSQSYVAKLLNGQCGMTLAKLSDVFLAFGRELHLTDESASR